LENSSSVPCLRLKPRYEKAKQQEVESVFNHAGNRSRRDLSRFRIPADLEPAREMGKHLPRAYPVPCGRELNPLPEELPECLLGMTGFRSRYGLEIAASIAQILVAPPEKFVGGRCGKRAQDRVLPRRPRSKHLLYCALGKGNDLYSPTVRPLVFLETLHRPVPIENNAADLSRFLL
jgi:hypothetical protein